MKITRNGEPVQVPPGTMTSDLVPDGVAGRAIAVNGVVVPRDRLTETALSEGDVVEVVTAVQGG